MIREELVEEIKKVLVKYDGDNEVLHSKTDDLLFEYINDKEIYDLCHGFARWCA